MQIMVLFGNLIHRKSNVLCNMSISAVILVLINPLVIFDVGFILSYVGTLSIIIFNKYVEKILNFIEIKITKFFNTKIPKKLNKFNIMLLKIINLYKKIIIITISANVLIIPVSIYYFYKFSPTFIVSNLLVQPMVPIVLILCFLQLCISSISFEFGEFFFNISNIVITIFILLSKICEKISLFNILVSSKNLIVIIIVYVALFLVKYILQKYKLSFNIFLKKVIRLIKFSVNLIIIIVLICNISIYIFLPTDLKLYFIDVGQGDSCLIKTPFNKTILIDGGGNDKGNFDIGEKKVAPFLLARNVSVLDYIFISHFDSDHIGGLFYIIENFKVKNIIISNQSENSENYIKFQNLINRKKLNVIYVKAGNTINIEKNLRINILWPENNLIEEKGLNNNSIVFKLCYLNKSILFTGDIEKLAEDKIIKKYQNTNVLNSDILKVAHHGSKTSSNELFLKKVTPVVSLIGVGKNNKFGHPSNEVINRLKNLNCKIYRTDQMGEIDVIINIHGIISHKYYYNYKKMKIYLGK